MLRRPAHDRLDENRWVECRGNPEPETLGFRIYDLGFRILGLGFRIYRLGLTR